jgi:hypothetical protein
MRANIDPVIDTMMGIARRIALRMADAVLIALLFLFLSCEAQRDEASASSRPPGHALIDGIRDEPESYPEVCTFLGELFPGGPTVSGCTGTLISPNALVTAAHCSLVFASNPGVNCGAAVSIASPRLTGRFVVHPGYSGNLGTIGQDRNDLAVFVLDEPLQHVKEGRLPPLGVLNLDAHGALPNVPVTIVGYGIDRLFDPDRLFDYLLEPKIRRSGRARLATVTSDYMRLTRDPTIGCFLDSGGPVFVGNRSRFLLATFQVGDCTSFSQYIRLDTASARDFLEQFTRAEGGTRD